MKLNVTTQHQASAEEIGAAMAQDPDEAARVLHSFFDGLEKQRDPLAYVEMAQACRERGLRDRVAKLLAFLQHDEIRQQLPPARGSALASSTSK